MTLGNSDGGNHVERLQSVPGRVISLRPVDRTQHDVNGAEKLVLFERVV